MQGKGVGSWFINKIEERNRTQGMNGILLNTERGYPAVEFYKKNKFKIFNDILVLDK